MTTMDVERLRQIKTLPSLVKYLRDDLDWPIDSEDVEDIVFDYDPTELGFEPSEAVQIKEVKQLRPLDTKQPWGIFWVNFEKKRLPVVMLRRVLGHLVVKKRASANRSTQRAWHLNDLLFMSAYGEEHDRAITLAHFWQDTENPGELPVLKVLGWDNADTILHLANAHHILSECLRWPENPSDIESWRKNWAAAFPTRHREVIQTTQQLVSELAKLAVEIRKRTNTILTRESKNGPVRRLYASFQATLIHDLTADDFADVIAQTVTYGLLAAKFSRPAGISVSNLVDMIPPTNPFLRELLGTFLSLAGRKGAFDFDELGFQDVVEVLNEANTDAVKADFGNRTRNEDPIIHFYEHFLSAYDKKKKVQRGVFYTPQPVVSYIVRSVHELLQTEFGLEDGLASTITWGEMLKKLPDLKPPKIRVRMQGKPEGEEIEISPDEFFVLMLDPATGTATFLVEVIEVIFQHLKAKWEKTQGRGMPTIPRSTVRVPHFKDYWNFYVTNALLPRLYGYELMMAPYTIAHMKLALKFSEINARLGQPDYELKFGGRAHIYLTNSLEPPSGFDTQNLVGIFPALAHEADAVNEVKRFKRFTVVIGNPPYSYESANAGEFIVGLVDRYYSINERRLLEKNPKGLQDDYVKFIRLGEYILQQAQTGIFGYVTNHGYIDNPTFRGMRYSLITSFSELFVLDLHGNIKKAGIHDPLIKDENVFDIQQGVAIGLFVIRGNHEKINPLTLYHSKIVGSRLEKYEYLSQHNASTVKWIQITTVPEFYLFCPQDTQHKEEYERNYKICEVFNTHSVGIQTGRDALAIGWSKEELNRTLSEFISLSPEEARERFDLGEDSRDWKVALAQADLKRTLLKSDMFVEIAYRPFDTRLTYYTGKARGIHMNPRSEVMNNLLRSINIALYTCRQISVSNWNHTFVCRFISDDCYISNKTSERGYTHPLYLSSNPERIAFGRDKEPNFTARFLKELATNLRLGQTKSDGLPTGLTPEDIFHYTYAVFHSPGYRSRYAEFLKIDFPRLPLTSSLELFRALAKIGDDLVALHLMESPKLDKHLSKFVGKGDNGVVKVRYEDEIVWINPVQGFQGVAENVWNFHIGGYQVCEKWLKDRRGRKLSGADITHYQKVVVALAETIRLMAEIDEVIEKYGGWPGAFTSLEPAGRVSEVVGLETRGPGLLDRMASFKPEETVYAEAAETHEDYCKSEGSKRDSTGSPDSGTSTPNIVGKQEQGEGDSARGDPKVSRNLELEEDRTHPSDMDFDNLVCMVRAAITGVGSEGIRRDDLIPTIASDLGFERTGPRIREDINSAVNAASHRGISYVQDDVVYPDCRRVEDYPRDILKDLFLSAIGTAWITREDAMRAAARYLGFARTGSTIQDYFKSIINGLIREDRLEANGQWIKKR